MRNNNRILKILQTSYPNIFFITNNGDYRKIDLKKLFKNLNIIDGDFGHEIIADKNIFNSVELIDKALAWKNVTQTFQFFDDDITELYFHLDPLNTIENSVLDNDYINKFNYGQSIKYFRKHILHISQEELGNKIGLDKHYISKIENNKTDLEIKTLRKIYEVGFDKNLFIAYYDKNDLLKSFSNSIFNIKFINWADKHKSDLNLIEGIDNKVKKALSKKNINFIEDLSKIEFKELYEALNKNFDFPIYNFFESWLIQAKFIMNSDWISVIKLQQNLVESKNSKIEQLAKIELKEELYAVEYPDKNI